MRQLIWYISYIDTSAFPVTFGNLRDCLAQNEQFIIYDPEHIQTCGKAYSDIFHNAVFCKQYQSLLDYQEFLIRTINTYYHKVLVLGYKEYKNNQQEQQKDTEAPEVGDYADVDFKAHDQWYDEGGQLYPPAQHLTTILNAFSFTVNSAIDFDQGIVLFNEMLMGFFKLGIKFYINCELVVDKTVSQTVYNKLDAEQKRQRDLIKIMKIIKQKSKNSRISFNNTTFDSHPAMVMIAQPRYNYILKDLLEPNLPFANSYHTYRINNNGIFVASV